MQKSRNSLSVQSRSEDVEMKKIVSTRSTFLKKTVRTMLKEHF